MRLILVFLMLLFLGAAVQAQETLPVSVQTAVKAKLAPVGSGTYRKYGFSVYRATLWAPDGAWDAAQPYALQLRYRRDVSQETLADSVKSDIADQGGVDAAVLSQWNETIDRFLPAVKEGDIMVGLYLPGRGATLYLNGAQIATIRDDSLAHAFFNIWLGDNADEDLKAALLGKGG